MSAKKIDIVIPLGKGSTRNNLELRFALRSIAEYAEDRNNVYIISDDPPDWLNNIRIIPCADRFPHNKDANIISKLLAACKIQTLSEEFVFWSDDQLALQKFFLRQLPAVYNRRCEKDFTTDKIWHKRMRHTFEYLKKQNIFLQYNHDSHLPQRMNKQTFKKIMENINYVSAPGYCVNTLYFGLAKIPAYIAQESLKVTIEQAVILKKLPENKMFIGYNDKALEGNLPDLLKQRFPLPCQYEKALCQIKAGT